MNPLPHFCRQNLLLLREQCYAATYDMLLSQGRRPGLLMTGIRSINTDNNEQRSDNLASMQDRAALAASKYPAPLLDTFRRGSFLR
jgi:hypothetical protein